MDVVERLTLEAAQADTMIAAEHRQRYRFAASLCRGDRVLDLCSGSGYGSAILAETAAQVVGIDNDAATVDAARAAIARRLSNVTFQTADAVEFLRGGIDRRFDAVVCFEGLEHLTQLDQALSHLRSLAQRGVRIVASVPNGKLFDEENPHHATQFGYDEAQAAFAEFPSLVMVPQYLAEGSLICPPGAAELDVEVRLEDRDEPEYANHFLFCVNFSADAIGLVHHGHMQLSASPVFNRWAEDLKRGAWQLRRENARLARARLGKGGSAAASALTALAGRDVRMEVLEQRCDSLRQRVHELEAALSPPPTLKTRLRTRLGVRGKRNAPTRFSSEGVSVTSPAPLAVAPGEDPNAWEMRRRRAAEALIPWIEQTISLAGKTVLEYGCGDGAVSCAFAARCEKLIGVDIDPGWIELAHQHVRDRAASNIELEVHPVETIFDAVAARRGQIDVFLLYAVLEHLTVQQRLRVLELARDVVKAGGVIVVCETPNRLIYFDHHTAQIPFFHFLPDELAAAYHPRSARRDFTDALTRADAGGGPEGLLKALARWGRGVSFHEFEVVFGDLSRHVLASNYDPQLFGERPVQPDEVILARYLNRWRPDLAPVWSRYWLDLILSPQALDRLPSSLRPWTADTVASPGVGWTGEETLQLSGPQATLRVGLPQPTSRVVLGCRARGVNRLLLDVGAEGARQRQRAQVSASEGQPAFASFSLPAAQSRLEIRASAACEVLFVGYES